MAKENLNDQLLGIVKDENTMEDRVWRERAREDIDISQRGSKVNAENTERPPEIDSLPDCDISSTRYAVAIAHFSGE